ncbi:hypothetical protein PRK78_002905 [Emydomyces testavorans]|uniref:Uncharacterized protein n=1 Tax=Emydomyces testavorans TaxID=2070801 RepID=A0AAF0DFU3_9EURO|nr:hypothetical protein PRK78_002905 [Emydomyces testavorans]
MNAPCVLCIQHTFPKNLKHVCNRQWGECKLCEARKKQCETVPDDLLPLVKELFELLEERKKHKEGVFLRIINDEMIKKSKEFNSKYRAYLKELKKHQLAKKKEEHAKTSSYSTRSKAVAETAHPDAATGSVKADEHLLTSMDAPKDAIIERLCIAVEGIQKATEGIHKCVNKIANMLENDNIGIPLDTKIKKSPSTPTLDDRKSVLGKRSIWDLE